MDEPERGLSGESLNLPWGNSPEGSVSVVKGNNFDPEGLTGDSWPAGIPWDVLGKGSTGDPGPTGVPCGVGESITNEVGGGEKLSDSAGG